MQLYSLVNAAVPTYDADMAVTCEDGRIHILYTHRKGAEIQHGELEITVADIAAHPELTDNAEFVFPFDMQSGAFTPGHNVQLLSCANKVDHKLALDLLNGVYGQAVLSLFVPFSSGLGSFADCSLGIRKVQPDRITCNLPVVTTPLFHYRANLFYKPVLRGAATPGEDGLTTLTVKSLFRGAFTATPCLMQAEASAGTILPATFTLNNEQTLTLNTAGVAPGTLVEVLVKSRSGVLTGSVADIHILEA